MDVLGLMKPHNRVKKMDEFVSNFMDSLYKASNQDSNQSNSGAQPSFLMDSEFLAKEVEISDTVVSFIPKSKCYSTLNVKDSYLC